MHWKRIDSFFLLEAMGYAYNEDNADLSSTHAEGIAQTCSEPPEEQIY